MRPESFEQLMPENKAPSVKLQQFEEITQHFKAIYSGIAPMLMNLFKIAIVQAKFLKEHRSFKQFIRSLMIYLIISFIVQIIILDCYYFLEK